MSTPFDEEVQTLSSAEDFLDYFNIQYEVHVVQVNRLHILQRFHSYLERERANDITDEATKRAVYSRWLEQAYQDFVHSDAQTEKVFKVFQRDQPQETFIAVEDLLGKK